jgi:hypothetical protein
MVGAGAAWILGMIPSTVMALQTPAPTAATATEPPAIVQYALALGLGVVTGPLLGFAQWTVLRRLVPRAGRWLWANALAWGVGMPLIFVGMNLVPWSGSGFQVAVALYGVCAVTGAVVGAIHGRTLERLIAPGPVSHAAA